MEVLEDTYLVAFRIRLDNFKKLLSEEPQYILLQKEQKCSFFLQFLLI